TLNEIAPPIVPTGTIRVTLAGEVWPAVVPFDWAGVSHVRRAYSEAKPATGPI
ncbi:hypothetical protein SAMN05192565_1771, partial [Methylobacterium gossipiicola]